MTKENGNVNSPFSFEDCFLLPYAVVSTGAREWVTLGKFKCLRGVDFVLGDVCKRKSWREWEERVSETWLTVSFSVSVSKIEKRGRRVEESEVRHACFTKQRRLGTTFPPKAQHGTVLGTTFPPKAHTTPFWGPCSPPNFPRWTSPFFLSFLVSFWFQWINGFGLFFNLRY